MRWQPNPNAASLARVLSSAGVAGYHVLAYAQVAEPQRRRAVHYHVLVLTGIPIPYLDQVGWWSHGSTRVGTARTIFYIMKYGQKGQFVDGDSSLLVFPEGPRLCSV
jgi:hypothetical protein